MRSARKSGTAAKLVWWRVSSIATKLATGAIERHMGDGMSNRRRNPSIVTWNIRFGVEIDAAIERLNAHPRLRNADALLLQELDGDGATRIAQALGLDLYYEAACRHPQTGRDFGNAILSRLPMHTKRVVKLPNVAVVGGTPRIAVRATAPVGGLDVSLWTTHAETPAMRRQQRREQFRAIASSIADDRSRRLILGGDFNTVTRRGVHVLSGLLADAETERVSLEDSPTLRRGGRSFALDHVFHRGMAPIAAGVVAPGAASDHSAVWVEFATISGATKEP
ncbi:MAG: endonuclease/exonuclease/phosphatase family protein [Ilumatobacter sp.]